MKNKTKITLCLSLLSLIAIFPNQKNVHAVTYFEYADQDPTDFFTDSYPKRIMSNFGENAQSEALISWQVNKEVSSQTIRVVESSRDFSEAEELTLFPSNSTKVERFYQVENPQIATSSSGNISGTMTLWGMESEVVKPAEYLERYICHVEIKDLLAETTYKYQVGTGIYWSEVCQFKTGSNDEDFTFTVFSDPQDGTYGDYRNTTKVVNGIRNNANVDFATCLGDISDLSQYEKYYDSFFNTQTALTHNYAFPTIPGNHETLLFERFEYSYNELLGEARAYNAHFYNPQNGPDDYIDHKNLKVDRNSSYYYIYDNCLFVYLNTQYETTQLKELAKWADEVMTNNPSKYIIVAMHKGCYGNYYYGSMATIYGIFAPTFEKHKVDLVMSGHDHTYARTAPMQGNKATDYQGDGTIYWIVATPGPKYNTPASDAGWQFAFRNDKKLSKGIYSNVHVTKNGIKVEAFDLDHNPYDSFTIPAKRNVNGELLTNNKEVEVITTSYGNKAKVEVLTNYNNVKDIALELQDETVLGKGDMFNNTFMVSELMSNFNYPYQIRVNYDDNTSKVHRFTLNTDSSASIENNKLELKNIIDGATIYEVLANGESLGEKSVGEQFNLSILNKGNYCLTIKQKNGQEVLAIDKIYYRR